MRSPRDSIDLKEPLTPDERGTLLRLARQGLEHAVRREPLPALERGTLTPRLLGPGASFVTLTLRVGELRGCIGALEPYQPLADDVREHAAAAALEDPRFPPVIPAELDGIAIEVSCLTVPSKLDYKTPEDLLTRLRPGVDGVLLRDGYRRATYLPQVWEKIPGKVDFLNSLCQKMGLPPGAWQKRHLDVLLYAVEEFHE